MEIFRKFQQPEMHRIRFCVQWSKVSATVHTNHQQKLIGAGVPCTVVGTNDHCTHFGGSDREIKGAKCEGNSRERCLHDGEGICDKSPFNGKRWKHKTLCGNQCI